MEPCEQSHIDDLKRIQQAIKTETAKSRMDSIDASLHPLFSGQMVEWGLNAKCFLNSWRRNWQKKIMNDMQLS